MILNKFLSKVDYKSYEDLYKNFKITIPNDFNFAYDVVDEYAKNEPKRVDMKAMVKSTRATIADTTTTMLVIKPAVVIRVVKMCRVTTIIKLVMALTMVLLLPQY